MDYGFGRARLRGTYAKKGICLLAFLLLAGFLCMSAACGKKNVQKGRTVQVYYVSATETKVEPHDCDKPVGSAEEQIKTLLSHLSVVPEKQTCKAPLGMGFQVLDTEYKDGSLTLNVDKTYLEMTPSAEVLVRACLVRTLLQADEVKRLQILVEGNGLIDAAGESVGWMTADQFIYNDGSEINSYEMVRVKLYFANQEGDKLIAAYREKYYSTNVSLDKFVVEEILSGPSGKIAGLYRTVNADTKILSVMTKDGICYVNLDANFLTAVGNVAPEVAIYSIVNSLTELPNVNRVQILVNGEIPETFENSNYEKNLDLVTTL